MKIAIADNNARKFIGDLIDHWTLKGHDIKMQYPNHEVKYEPGASEKLAQWADIYYIDTWDNNIHYLYKLYHGDQGVSRTPDWDNNKKPTIVVRALDWEVWIGLARDQLIIDWVDKIIVIAPHIEKELRKHGDFGDKIKLIRPGVNLDKFTLKTKPTDGFQLGMVLGDMWKYKNHMGGLDIFTTLYQKDNRWRLHIRGQHENSTYDPINFEHYLESRGIKNVVTLYPHVADVNEWLENIDILLHPGQKEAFCYAVGEAAAKDIPCIVNDFYGSRDIWPEEILYRTHEEAIGMITDKNKHYIFKPRDVKKMMEEYDQYLGL